jgi:DNA-3-methyladenine glycosylase I
MTCMANRRASEIGTHERRCSWAAATPDMIRYHDTEWGRPVHDDRRLFEMLLLEGAQAGLSWDTILRRREGYRLAFAGFDPVKVAAFDRSKKAALLRDTGIIRNRLKIDAAVSNARAFLALQEAFGSFDAYVWEFVGGAPIVNRWKRGSDIPAETRQSDVLSKDLRQRGFRFVGSTIVYAFMQAVGLVNDHMADCFLAGRRLRSGR